STSGSRAVSITAWLMLVFILSRLDIIYNDRRGAGHGLFYTFFMASATGRVMTNIVVDMANTAIATNRK
ncbi:MAG: hypothetical protein ORN57_01850, partial [Alphaproteobacteria bacterium]|nr:hypothetical protein [Alphaproteobacteria bacterium]